MNQNGWPTVALGNVLSEVAREERVQAMREYRFLGARWYAKGLYVKELLPGSDIRAGKVYRVEQGDFVYNRLFAWKGSFAVAGPEHHGCYVSNEFPCFCADGDRLSTKFLLYYLSREAAWIEALGMSTGGTPVSRNRLKENRFLSMLVPLPDRAEQDRIVAKIDTVAAKIDEARQAKGEIETEAAAMLRSAFDGVSRGAPRKPLAEVAPLVRRRIEVRMGEEYPELGIRSFGKGAFHKPALDFLAVGTKKLYRIEPGDLVFNNVFAWEGAIAVAQPDDAGRVGSHRFITCVPQTGVSTADFLCFYLLTPEGLKKIGEASPGGAGRNRTLGIEKLMEIEVPVPQFESQLWFDRLQNKVREMLAVEQEMETGLDAMLPSVLDRAFKGEL